MRHTDLMTLGDLSGGSRLHAAMLDCLNFIQTIADLSQYRGTEYADRMVAFCDNVMRIAQEWTPGAAEERRRLAEEVPQEAPPVEPEGSPEPAPTAEDVFPPLADEFAPEPKGVELVFEDMGNGTEMVVYKQIPGAFDNMTPEEIDFAAQLIHARGEAPKVIQAHQDAFHAKREAKYAADKAAWEAARKPKNKGGRLKKQT